ncbi:hypothetical protein QBC38DRAFT_480088 [Podospora fimiseda]|uniref:Uncharacterized protein n=1 Tax=Podospora fimiseda TaxID=252190 RepID=A0AAN7BND2_9PEZI|nr:hypothetical protein QBC38DRAFT_480088 [Podospora fimiseda]
MTTPYQDTTATNPASTSTSTLTGPTKAAPEGSSSPRPSTSTTLCEADQPKPKPKPQTPARYLYTERVAPPNPDYKPKPPSKLSKFMSKFQSPAVKSTKAKKKEEEDEEKRTGIKTYTAIGAPQGSGQWTADAVGNI